MNDNEKRGAQYRRLTGVYLGPLLGGSPEAWERANLVVFERIFAEYLRRVEGDPDHDVQALRDDDDDRWLAGMCVEVGVPVPADRAERLRIAREAEAFITHRIDAAYPGVVSAIEQLRRVGYVLHTASGEHSSELRGYLTGMGVLACFGTLYGPDLVNAPKTGPHYYRLILQHAGVSPIEALVVDDSESVLAWAASAGAQTVLCGPEPPRSPAHRHVRSLAELPLLMMYNSDV
jgi:HAD superfamily hydrolase (TIGR01509 family)